jgi:hypothetical protein
MKSARITTSSTLRKSNKRSNLTRSKNPSNSSKRPPAKRRRNKTRSLTTARIENPERESLRPN